MIDQQRSNACPPILFLVFNRPDTTVRVMEAIRGAKPEILFIAADGPRIHHHGEEEVCTEVRRIATDVDWKCEVKTLFRDKNLGCGEAIHSALQWFFSSVEYGIVLEDDCLPHPDFFPYCKELLIRYQDHAEIALISGNTFQHRSSNILGAESYYLSAFSHIWGWASWKRSILGFELHVGKINQSILYKNIEQLFPNIHHQNYWKEIFQMMKSNQIDTWDYPLLFHNWLYGRFGVLPKYNLVENIGFDSRATHTKTAFSMESLIPCQAILPLTHPETLCRLLIADEYYMNTYIQPSSQQRGYFQRILASIKNHIHKITRKFRHGF